MIVKSEIQAAIEPIVRYGRETFEEWSRLQKELLQMLQTAKATKSDIPIEVLADIVDASMKRMRKIVAD